MLTCHDTARLLDDFLDGRLDRVRERGLQDHLQRCNACRMRYEQAAALQAALRTLPAPSPAPGFVDQALARAAGGRGAPRRAVLGLALAATLLVGLGVGLFLQRPAPAPSVVLTLEQPETVRLMFETSKPLQGAMLALKLPENVELVGYAGRRELTWTADMPAGRNLLQLPLIAHGAPKGDLVASLSHGEESKALHVKIEVKPKGGLS